MRRARTILMAVVLMLLLAACSNRRTQDSSGSMGAAGSQEHSSAGSDGTTKPSTLVYGAESEFDILDPHAAGGWVTYRINYQIFEGLLGRDLTQSTLGAPKIIPVLAERFETNADKTVWTFYLRKGVKFHDGTDFNAYAVKFNVDRCFDPKFEYFYPKCQAMEAFHYEYPQLKSVEVVDDYTVRFTFGKPFGELPWNWTEGGMGNVVFISPEAIKKYGNEGVAEHPVGTGPFRFVERVRGDRVVLEKNPDYWGKEPPLTPAKVDRIVFRPIPDAAARVTALRTGAADVIIAPPPDSIEQLQAEGFQLVQGPVSHRWFFYINFKDPKMQDVRVRRALYMAIDREGIANNLLKGTAEPAYGYVAPGYPAFDKSFRPSWFTGYDPEKARQLLREAGVTDLEIVMRGPASGSGMILPVDIMQWVQRDWAKIGVKAKIETYEWITFLTMWNKGMDDGVQIQAMGSGDAPPPYEVWSSEWWGPKGHNAGYYANARVDELLKKAWAEPNDDQRAAYIREAHNIYMDDVAVIPVVHDKSPFMISPRVKGWIYVPAEWFDLRNVSVED